MQQCYPDYMTMDNWRKKANTNLRLLFFGMLGELSRIPLAALLDAGLDVVGVVIPASALPLPDYSPPASIIPISAEPPPSQLSLLNPYVNPTTLHLAWQDHIPVFASHRLDTPETLATLAGLNPDLICVSCFSQRLPKPLLDLPRLGCLNLHPSLLPDFRGPTPLFWTFRQGQRNTGVTVHFMDEGLDTGDIALQAPLSLPDGISGAEAERLCAARGGRLLVEAVQELAQGQLAPRPQPPGGSTYPWPAPADFRLDTNWPARRAFNFMRGTAEWNQPYPVTVAAGELELAIALSFTTTTPITAPLVRQGDEVLIHFTPGVLQARLA